MEPPDSSPNITSAKDSDVLDPSLFVPATVAVGEKSAIQPQQQPRDWDTNNVPAQASSSMLVASLPLPPGVGGLPLVPTQQIHRQFVPYAVEGGGKDNADINSDNDGSDTDEAPLTEEDVREKFRALRQNHATASKLGGDKNVAREKTERLVGSVLGTDDTISEKDQRITSFVHGIDENDAGGKPRKRRTCSPLVTDEDMVGESQKRRRGSGRRQQPDNKVVSGRSKRVLTGVRPDELRQLMPRNLPPPDLYGTNTLPPLLGLSAYEQPLRPNPTPSGPGSLVHNYHQPSGPQIADEIRLNPLAPPPQFIVHNSYEPLGPPSNYNFNPTPLYAHSRPHGLSVVNHLHAPPRFKHGMPPLAPFGVNPNTSPCSIASFNPSSVLLPKGKRTTNEAFGVTAGVSGHNSFARADPKFPPVQLPKGEAANDSVSGHAGTPRNSVPPAPLYYFVPPELQIRERAPSQSLGQLREAFHQAKQDSEMWRAEASEIKSYNPQLQAFRNETQTVWENDTELKRLVDTGERDRALDQFRGIVRWMSVSRDISKKDMADVFQRVTGAKMVEK
jgi:hypothetical protein